jgi:hypothetical protein
MYKQLLSPYAFAGRTGALFYFLNFCLVCLTDVKLDFFRLGYEKDGELKNIYFCGFIFGSMVVKLLGAWEIGKMWRFMFRAPHYISLG